MKAVGQSAFRAAILDPERPPPAGLIDPACRPAGRRFDVYRNNVVVSLSEALAEAFPVVRKLVGGDNFGILARRFLRLHPPDSPVIAMYGAAMPEFLERFEPVGTLGYLPDVARLELALRHSYHAADAAPISPKALEEIAPDLLPVTCLSIAPAVRIVASPWPVVSIWTFNMADGPKPEMRAETALVTRPDFDPQIARLTPAGGTWVSALIRGATFAAAVAEATEVDRAFDLAPALAALLDGNVITGLKETTT